MVGRGVPMIGHDVQARSGARDRSVHWRGHAFLFERKDAPGYEATTGLRLLVLFVALEGGRALPLYSWLRLPLPPIWVRVPVMLGLALLMARFVAGVSLPQIGVRPWREWSGTEKSYAVQIVLIGNIVFLALFADRLRTILAGPHALGRVTTVFIPYFLYGFYQEVMYRGILQTELVRRWGAACGILVSNALYTFGPLHSGYFSRGAPAALALFAGVFAIGLIFAVLFRRSGNLLIVAVMHAIGNSYIVGSLGPVS